MSDASIDRLTDNERECLERVLDHQTAKEMARDLGISHHAVEKRLKRARQKLGATTSLEAARWYGQTVSGSSDLAKDDDKSAISGPASPPSGDRSRRFGIMVFIALVIGGIALATNSSMTDGIDIAAEEESKPQVSKATFDPVKDRNRFRIEMAPVEGGDPYDLGFETMDNDRSKTVSVEEFLKAARMFDYPGYMASGGDENNSLTAIFDRLDSNSNGLIERSEYRNVSFTDARGEHYLFEIVFPGKQRPSKFQSEYQMLIGDVSDAEAQRIAFSVLDDDRSGVIDLSEFVEGSPNIGSGIKDEHTILFHLLDDNNDGRLDRSEFRTRTVIDTEGVARRLYIGSAS